MDEKLFLNSKGLCRVLASLHVSAWDTKVQWSPGDLSRWMGSSKYRGPESWPWNPH